MIKITKIIARSIDGKKSDFPHMIKDCDKAPFKISLLEGKQKVYDAELASVNCFAIIKIKHA